VIEDTMFFPRLRRHAKWMFLFLALAFALGFVGFGVGAGGVGFGDILKGSGGGGPSVSKAQQKVFDNPKDAQAFRELATAQQAHGDTDGAIQSLGSYTVLRPRDTDALRELASLYLSKASAAQQRLQILQYRAAYLAPGSVRSTVFALKGAPLAADPITNAVSSSFEQDVSAAATDVQTASSQAVEAYKKITRVRPKDPAVQLELAQAAQSAGDSATTIAAFKAFLKLAPQDPTAPEVRRLLKQLQKQSSQ
jgi:tetratricopeptide (TPR) repeat protein